MSNKSSADTRRVRLYPTATGDYIPGVPAVQLLLEPDVAEQLLAYRPPAFTTTRPEDTELDEAPLETLDGLPVPWLPVDTSPAGLPPSGPTADTTPPGEPGKE